ncbi:MAG: hypothetical protein LVQ95_04195 [Candidatus Micrarchaeales archaeon]|nr:hypothetical protein [Candidatus Micrarchaeales archaeon]
MDTSNAQSSVEYIVIYGWALITLAIIVAILFYALSIPKTITPNSCTFSSSLLCSDIVIGTNQLTGYTAITFQFTNEQMYNISNPTATVNVGAGNSTVPCLATLVPPGGSTTCTVQTSLKSTLGQFVSGSIYVSVGDCGLVAGYAATHNCAGAPIETYSGSFSGHAELATFSTVTTTSSTSTTTTLSTTTSSTSTTSTTTATTTIIPTQFVYTEVNGVAYKISTITNSIVAQTPSSIYAGGYSITSTLTAPDFTVTPDGKSLYLLNDNNGNFVIINTSTFTIVGNILEGPTEYYPQQIAISPNGNFLYALAGCCSFYNGGYVQNMTIISLATNSIVGTVVLPTGPTSGPSAGHEWEELSGFAVTPNGANVFVAGDSACGDCGGTLYDIADAGGGGAYLSQAIYGGLSVPGTPYTGANPAFTNLQWVTPTSDSSTIYVSNDTNITNGAAIGILQISTQGLGVVKNIVIPYALAYQILSPDGSTLYATSYNYGRLYEISASSGSIINTYDYYPSAGTYSSMVYPAFSSDGSELYALDNNGNFSTLSASTLTLLGSKVQLFSRNECGAVGCPIVVQPT